MGKCLASLVALAASLLFPNQIFADEQVRRVQEELRKRHLFYADPDGEKGPALAVAIKYYQAKKGFAPTGAIDPLTLASLGISPSKPSAATTPFTLVKRGQVHGANGERLPGSPPFVVASETRVNQVGPGLIDRDYLEFDLAEFPRQRKQRRSSLGKSVRLTSSRDEPAVPAEGTLNAPIRPINFALGSAVSGRLLLRPEDPEFQEPVEIDDKRIEQGDMIHPRRSPRRTRRPGPRKERNPLVLTYRSVDRAIRSLFGDSQTKKKRSGSRRL